MTTGHRAVIADDNAAITLTVYSSAQPQPMAALELPPLTAIRLASELAAAAARHLSRPAAPAARKSARGGDARAAERARRDAGVRQLAVLLGSAGIANPAGIPTFQAKGDVGE